MCRLNAFFYGNTVFSQPEATRVFPLLQSKQEKRIRFNDCRFGVSKYSEATARVAMWRQLRIPNIFTLEASFYGYQDPQTLRHINFTPKSFCDIGRSVCSTLHLMLLNELPLNLRTVHLIQNQQNKNATFVQSKPTPEEIKSASLLESATPLVSKLVESAMEELQNFRLKANEADDDDNDSGMSESDCSEDELDADLFTRILPQNLKKKSSKVQPAASISVKPLRKSKKTSKTVAFNKGTSSPNPVSLQAEHVTTTATAAALKPDAKLTGIIQERKRMSSIQVRAPKDKLLEPQKIMFGIVQPKQLDACTQTEESLQTQSLFLQTGMKYQSINVNCGGGAQERKGRQNPSLPPRPCSVKNSQSDQISFASTKRIVKEDDVLVLNQAIRMPSKRFWVQGQKVQDEIKPFRSIETFKCVKFNSKEVSTQTVPSTDPLPSLPEQRSRSMIESASTSTPVVNKDFLQYPRKSFNSKKESCSPDVQSALQQQQQPSAKPSLLRKRNTSLNGPPLNHLLAFEDSGLNQFPNPARIPTNSIRLTRQHQLQESNYESALLPPREVATSQTNCLSSRTSPTSEFISEIPQQFLQILRNHQSQLQSKHPQQESTIFKRVQTADKQVIDKLSSNHQVRVNGHLDSQIESQQNQLEKNQNLDNLLGNKSEAIPSNIAWKKSNRNTSSSMNGNILLPAQQSKKVVSQAPIQIRRSFMIEQQVASIDENNYPQIGIKIIRNKSSNQSISQASQQMYNMQQQQQSGNLGSRRYVIKQQQRKPFSNINNDFQNSFL